jgi:hypothetical protein
VSGQRRTSGAYRVVYPLREGPCVVCGLLFAKRPDALLCSPVYRQFLDGKQRRAVAAVGRTAERVTERPCSRRDHVAGLPRWYGGANLGGVGGNP